MRVRPFAAPVDPAAMDSSVNSDSCRFDLELWIDRPAWGQKDFFFLKSSDQKDFAPISFDTVEFHFLVLGNFIR